MRMIDSSIGLSIFICTIMVSCTNDLSEIVDYEQQVKNNADFQQGVELAKMRYQKMDSIITSIVECPDGRLLEKINLMSCNDINEMCGNFSIEEISTLSLCCEDYLIDNLIERTSVDDARDILSMGYDFFYLGNPNRYELLVQNAKDKSPTVKTYMYRMAGILSETETLFARPVISRAYGSCEDIITRALVDAAIATEWEKDIAEFLPEESLVDLLVSLGLDAADAVITAHKYHECKMGALLP